MKVENTRSGKSLLGLYHAAASILHGIMDALEAQGNFEEAYEVEQTAVGALLGERPLGEALAPYPRLATAVEAYLQRLNSLDSSEADCAAREIWLEYGYDQAEVLLNNFPKLSAALGRCSAT